MFVVKTDNEEWEILEDLEDTKKELNMVEVAGDDQTVIELFVGILFLFSKYFSC